MRPLSFTSLAFDGRDARRFSTFSPITSSMYPPVMRLTNAIAVLALVVLVAAPAQARPDRPNVVLLVVDDLGWSDSTCYGNDYHETPNIDALARAGVRFTDAYAASPVCSPTRAALMTGRDPVRVGITDWIKGWPISIARPKARVTPPEDRDQLPLEEHTIAEALKDRGYHTAFVGKWHLGDTGYFPTDQGFDINIGGHHRGSPPGGYYAPFKNPQLENKPTDDYLTDRLTDEAVAYIDARNPDQPFFLCLAYYNVHTPIQANTTHLRRFKDKAALNPAGDSDPAVNPDYASMVYAVDQSVGRLLETLEANGITDDTIIVFTSDNGGLERVRDQAPLRAGKAWLYEGGIRVPLIIKAPGVSRTDAVSSQLATSADIPVTLLELTKAHTDPPTTTFTDGQSLVPALRSNNTTARDLFWHYPHYHSEGHRPGGAVRSGHWKLIEDFESGRVELYNLATDLGESTDLASTRPDKAAELILKLRNWRERLGAKMPTPR